MSWRTSKVPRAALLIARLTVPKLLAAIDGADVSVITSVKTDEGVAVFTSTEAKQLIETLSAPEVRFGLERAQVFDVPKLTITGVVKRQDGTPQAIVKDFTKLSLGQQQSVLLALLLSSGEVGSTESLTNRRYAPLHSGAFSHREFVLRVVRPIWPIHAQEIGALKSATSCGVF